MSDTVTITVPLHHARVRKAWHLYTLIRDCEHVDDLALHCDTLTEALYDLLLCPDTSIAASGHSPEDALYASLQAGLGESDTDTAHALMIYGLCLGAIDHAADYYAAEAAQM